MKPLTWIIGDAATGEIGRTARAYVTPRLLPGESIIGIEARPAKARGRIVFGDLSSPALGAGELTASQ